MKREILFRGFCPSKNGKQIITLDGGLPFSFRGIRGDWVFGDLIHNIDCVKVRERETDINRIAKSYEVIPETVCEWTGLTDKNGRRIFEGDILQLCKATYPCLVYWNGAGWSIERNGKRVIYACDMDIAHDLRNMEVIGNIYDNPELLE